MWNQQRNNEHALLLFSSSDDELLFEKLQGCLSAIPLIGDCQVFRSIDQLARRFSNPLPLPGLIVLHPTSRLEVNWLVERRTRFDNRFVILILSDLDRSFLGRCCLLFPRFMIHEQGDFSDLAAVVEKQCTLGARQKVDSAGGGKKSHVRLEQALSQPLTERKQEKNAVLRAGESCDETGKGGAHDA